MEALTFLEYYKNHQIDSSFGEKQLREIANKLTQYFDFVSQPFKPEMIGEFFNEFEESYSRYPWRFWHKDSSIEVPHHFKFNPELYISVNNKDSERNGGIRILDDFISLIYRYNLPITFKITEKEISAYSSWEKWVEEHDDGYYNN